MIHSLEIVVFLVPQFQGKGQLVVRNCALGRRFTRGCKREELTVRGLLFGGSRREWTKGFRLWVCSHFQNRKSGAEPERRRGFWIFENLRNDGGGSWREPEGLLVPHQRLLARGKFHFAGKGWYTTAPVADSVTVNANLGSGFEDGLAFGQESENLVLLRSQSRVRRVIR
jgi:hypothetical protein